MKYAFRVAMNAGEMKTHEEYLVEFEAKLLGIPKNLYKSVNQDFATAFGLSMLVALFQFGSVTKLSFLGADFVLNKINIFIFIPVLISIIYIFINFQLVRIAEVYRLIHENAKDLRSGNQEAKPITMREIHLFGGGVTGLILSLSRWQAKTLLENNPFKFRPYSKERPQPPSKEDSLTKEFPIIYNILLIIKMVQYILRFINIYLINLIGRFSWIGDVIVWFIITAIRSFITVFLFLLPIVIVGYYNYLEFFYQKPITFGVPLLSLGILVFVAISTVVYGLKLFVKYFDDLIESERLKEDFTESIEETVEELTQFIMLIRRIANIFK